MVIKRMRWKALYINSKDEKVKNMYGLKSFNCPPQLKELVLFEDDSIDLVRKIKFNNFNNYNTRDNFQSMLRNNISKIRSIRLTPADTTSNMYRLTKDEHDGLVCNAVTATYKKANNRIKNVINEEGKELAERDGVVNKMEVNGTSNCFITLKAHKDNFMNKPMLRLINPAKNEIGKISKGILDEINKKSIPCCR